MENEYILDDSFQFENKVKYAGFWIRVLASIIDTLALLPLIGFSFYNLIVLKSFPLQILYLLLTAVYKPYMEYKYGATLGKMAVNIKVVDFKFQRISLNQSLLRYTPWFASSFVGLISTYYLFMGLGITSIESFKDIQNAAQNDIITTLEYLTSLFMLISVIVVATNEFKQGLHDKIANTYCIYK